jgi:hypothetical protein
MASSVVIFNDIEEFCPEKPEECRNGDSWQVIPENFIAITAIINKTCEP